MRIIFAPAAITDLQKISDHIATDNRERAVSFVQERDYESLLFPGAGE